MNAERWQQIKSLLGEVLDHAPEERVQFLASSAGADTELKLEVARLLEASPDEQKFLEPPPRAAIDPPLRRISLAFRGCSIGDYELEEEIGRGSSGTVYRARQVSLGRPAAVKILAHHLCASPLARQRFQREAEAASKLRHGAIVSVYSFGEESGAFYIAMELVKGDNLRDLIAECISRKAGVLEPLPHNCDVVSDPRVAAGLVEKLARGLQHCHENRVIHRDIKPENIVIDEKRQPRLIDFGLAKDCALDGLTETGALAGTPHYMSPEQALALGSAVDLRTDIYSLGVVLYELLSLKRPFEFMRAGDLLHAIGHESPRHVALANPGAPPGLAAVCMKAMAKRPADRYPTAAAMADDLRLFLSGGQTSAHKYSGVQKVRDLAVRHRGAVAVALLVMCLGTFMGVRSLRRIVRAETLRTTDSPAAVHAIREAFDRSIDGMSESEQLKRRETFNQYLIGRIADNAGQIR